MEAARTAKIESHGVDRVVEAIYGIFDSCPLPSLWAERMTKVMRDALPDCRVWLRIGEVSPRAPSPLDVRIVRRVDAAAWLECVLRFRVPLEPSSYQRSLVKRLALHLENGARLVTRPENVTGHLDRHGMWIGGAPDEWARRELWASLLSGRRSLAARSCDGETSYLVMTAPYGRWRALTSDERAVTHRFVSGASSKAIAHELALSPPRVSRALRHAAAKVGLPTPRELITIGALLAPAEARSSEAPLATLTEAEHAVLLLVREGHSNSAIAERRKRSLHTIANQVASILRKLDCGSRLALSTLPPPPPFSGVFLSAGADAGAGERDPRGAALAER